MKTSWSRILGVLLCVLTVACLLPLAVGATVYEEDGAFFYVADDETYQVTDEAVNDAVSQADESLPKLGTPTDLEWGYDHDAWIWDAEEEEYVEKTVAMPGMISWKPVEPDQAEAWIKVYRVGEDSAYKSHSWSFGNMKLPEWRSIDSFIMDDPESGTYYFTVQSEGDGINYANSDIATSDAWTYVKPSAKVGSCSDLGWNWPNVSYSAPGNMTNVGGYEVEWYFAPTANEEPTVYGGTWSRHIANGIFAAQAHDWLLQDCGVGYYYYKVRALSDDITVACNGEWSELSPAYNLTELAGNIKNDLQEVIADSDNLSDDEIRDAVQSMDTEDLKSAMLADENVVDNVAALEEKVGGAAAVEVTDDASDFDQSKISIVGANLNNAESAEEPIKLVIDKPEKDHVLDAAYNNAVAVKFSMDLENVEDTENLAVPVKITLPVPANINPGFLVILHYHADGTVEELMGGVDVHLSTSNGQTYASFVLTSFSDFVLTQQVASVPMHRMYDPNSGEHFYTGAEAERDFLVKAGWHYEGVGFNFPLEGEPVYRLYEPVHGEHLYTMDEAEKAKLISWGWNDEGVAFNSAGEDEVPQYRLHNPNAKRGGYHFTGSEEERDLLISVGWINEGIGWYSCEE